MMKNYIMMQVDTVWAYIIIDKVTTLKGTRKAYEQTTEMEYNLSMDIEVNPCSRTEDEAWKPVWGDVLDKR